MFHRSANREESNAEKYQARQRVFGTKNVLPLWVADMDIETPDFILNALKKRLAHGCKLKNTKPQINTFLRKRA